MKPNLRPFLLRAAVFAFAATLFVTAPAGAAEVNSRLNEITKSKKLRVCQFPLYYSISFRNPKTGVIEGIDADLAKEIGAWQRQNSAVPTDLVELLHALQLRIASPSSRPQA